MPNVCFGYPALVLSHSCDKSKERRTNGARRSHAKFGIATDLTLDSVVSQQAAEIDDLSYVAGLVHGEKADHAADGAIKAG